jgi:hypothetical protein
MISSVGASTTTGVVKMHSACFLKCGIY